MWEPDFAQRMHMGAFAERPHGAGEIAESVGGKNGGAFEGRDEKSAGHVRGVVLDVMELAGDAFRSDIEGSGKVFADAREACQRAGAIDRETRHANRVAKLGEHSRTGIARNGDVIDFCELYTRAIEAKLDRARRKPGSVFHAIQPLFFDGGDQAAVDNDSRGCIRVIRVDPKNYHVKFGGLSSSAYSTVLSGNRHGRDPSPVKACRCLDVQVALYPFIQDVEAPRPRPRRAAAPKVVPHGERVPAA